MNYPNYNPSALADKQRIRYETALHSSIEWTSKRADIVNQGRVAFFLCHSGRNLDQLPALLAKLRRIFVVGIHGNALTEALDGIRNSASVSEPLTTLRSQLGCWSDHLSVNFAPPLSKDIDRSPFELVEISPSSPMQLLRELETAEISHGIVPMPDYVKRGALNVVSVVALGPDKRLLGGGSAQIWKVTDDTVRVWIGSIFVIEQFRRQGIGTTIAHACLHTLSKRLGDLSVEVVADSYDGNSGSVEFLNALGMSIDHEALTVRIVLR